MKKNIRRIRFTRIHYLVCSLLLTLGWPAPLRADESHVKSVDEVRVTLSPQKRTLAEIFTEIESQTPFKFAYNEKVVPVHQAVHLKSTENETVKNILAEISGQTGLSFKQVNATLLVRPTGKPGPPETKISREPNALISGKVIDAADNSPIPGVNVNVPGTTVGTITDVDGSYRLNVPEEAKALVFSYVGYKTQTVEIRTSTVINVSLEEDARNLNEVVVTALGIKREERALGYATQTIQAQQLTDARTNNWAEALTGKVAGLNLINTSSGPIGSSRITLRGESSLNLDNNQALIVVDGVPVSNRITGTGQNAHLSADSPVDFGSAVSDLNPDDIENVTVLKGPAATALYGSRAANGALIITTKSGKRKENGLGVTINSNIGFERVGLRWPDYQFEYGEGRTDDYYSYLDSEDGINTSTNVSAGRAWGPRFNGQMYYQYNPDAPDGRPTERTLWRPYEDYISGFFRTGVTTTNNIALDGNTDKSTARLSLTHLKNEWIVPNTGFERISAAMSLSHQISSRLKVNAKANYTNKWSDNLPLSGYNNQTIMYFMIIGTAPNIDINWFKDYWQPGLENVEQKNPFNPGPDNIYLQVHEMLNKINRHGVIGNLSATYEFSPKLDFTVRSGIDFNHEFRTQQRPFSMTKYPRGMFRQQNVFSYEINSDFLFNFRDKIGSDISYSVSAGGNAMKQYYNFAGMYADQLSIPGNYMISNSLDQAVADPNMWQKAINSLYVSSEFDYRGKVFLNLTGRNDWSSTLPAGNNSFFYPSVSTSFVLDDIFTLPAFIGFSKLRLSWAQVGNDTRPYQTARYYDNIYGNSFTNPSTLYNANLKPEITSSYEAGLDVRVLNNRLGLDLTVYKNDSRNQILEVPVDITTGVSRILMNAGLISSQGVEVVLTGKPIKRERFGWNTTFTWSRNRSYVKELAEGIENQVIANHNTNVSIEARVGGRMGDMYGRGFQRSPAGEIIYLSNGLPAELDPVQRKFGNAFPDWKAGLLNEFELGNFRVSVLFDGQLGGHVYSQTNHKLNTLGKTKVTLPGREEGIVGEGVVRQDDGSFVPNTTRVPAMQYYEVVYQISNTETNTFDASFIKLREARIDYGLPRSFVSRLGIRQASVGVYGRDLLLFTKFPAFDPEAAMLNGGTIIPGIEMTQFPSTRTVGMNLMVKF